jgi:AraC-like DNA-binding protein
MTDLHEAEMLKGTYVQHMYPWHSHEEISLGLVLEGAIDLRTGSHQCAAKAGSSHRSTQRKLTTADQWTAEAGVAERSTSIPGWCTAPRRICEGTRPAPSIALLGPTFDDPEAARELFELHRRSEVETSAPEHQSWLVTLIVRLLMRHSEAVATVPTRVRELEELAAASGVPQFRLLRGFQQSVGLTPHAYQTQTRIRKACQILRSQHPLADIAIATGFADQAHLTRTFKSIMGTTPRQYRGAFHWIKR